MKRFVLECAAFVALQTAVVLALQPSIVRRHLGDHFLAAWNDKAARLQATPAPRVLLVGGSNWAFGVDSGLLETALRRPVVNLGLNAGLGREVMLRQAERAVRAGDVVLVALEYPLLGCEDGAHATVLSDLLEVAPGALRYVPFEHLRLLLDGGLGPLARRARALREDLAFRPLDRGGIYSRRVFDERGDAVRYSEQGRHLGPDHHGGLEREFELGHAEIAVTRLNRFGRQVRAAGGRAFYCGAPIPEDDLERDAERLSRLWALFEERLELPLLSAQPPAFPRQQFLDTPYHLRRKARLARTRALVGGLRAALARSSGVR